jgi:hypothetical protein
MALAFIEFRDDNDVQHACTFVKGYVRERHQWSVKRIKWTILPGLAALARTRINSR